MLTLDMVLEDRLNSLPWRFTPYYGHPHEYVVVDWSEEIKEIRDLVSEQIANNGYGKKFYKTSFRYVDIGDFTYWLMGKVMNRIKRGDNA